MIALETKSYFMRKIFPVVSFVLGPIFVSIGIFIPNILWKVIFILLGSSLVIGLYLSRKINSGVSKDVCSLCHGTGSVKLQSTLMAEHSVKSCLSYRAGIKTCGMCEGTGLKTVEISGE
ncbi:MAG: hypothetical protein GOP50_12535 [Candidatus Heimdallarchaeota archaeon]|nr:hypothetical protein [Candidatus Heimdallarchaeota archaeon]